MHVEFNVNSVVDVDPEKNGNSGIYIQKRYELQILNSHGVSEGDYKASYAGSLYRQKKPDKLVSRPAGEWWRGARGTGEASGLGQQRTSEEAGPCKWRRKRKGSSSRREKRIRWRHPVCPRPSVERSQGPPGVGRPEQSTDWQRAQPALSHLDLQTRYALD